MSTATTFCRLSLTLARSKQKEAEKSAKKWRKSDKESFGSDESFGHNLARPQRPPSRPGTAGSFRNTMLFRSPFANTEATSSMVDLAPPSARRPSASSLRQASSSSNLRSGKLKISAPIGPPQTLPMEGGPNSPLTPATPPRPGTSSSMKKDWVNPLDVHFGKDMSAMRPHTSAGPSAAKSPLTQFDFDIGPDSKGNFDSKAESSVGPNGYPSPPPSVKGDEQGLTRVSTEPKLSYSAKPPAPSSLRRVNTAEQTRLPSPAVSDELKAAEGPVIRNVIAKRETMTFHSPRRRSFSKQIDEQTTKRDLKKRTEEEKAEIKKRRQTEGFEGNFSAFNFGGPVVDTSVPLPTERAISPMSTGDSNESPIDPKADRKSARERGMSEAMTIETVNQEQKEETDNRSTMASSIDVIPRPLTQEIRRTGPQAPASHTPSLTPSVDSLTKPTRPRVDSDTRCPGTPTALRAPPPVGDRPSIRSQSSHDSQWSFKLEQAPPPKLNVDRGPESPLRAHPPSNSPKEAPARPQRPDSPGSRRGRSPERFDDAPPPKLNPDRRSQSPLRARQPAEGLFPTSKGLPRGRKPGPGAPPIQPASFYGNAPPPRPPRENQGVTSDPSWAERAEKHMSAIPAPLTPSMQTSFHDDDLHPWAVKKNDGPPSLAPPRLPSPTFSSLEESLSENILKTFDTAPSPEPNHGKPLISPVLSEFGVRSDGQHSPMRVEAKKAPPRPSPITLPPSSHGGTPNGSVKSPATGEFSPGFI